MPTTHMQLSFEERPSSQVTVVITHFSEMCLDIKATMIGIAVEATLVSFPSGMSYSSKRIKIFCKIRDYGLQMLFSPWLQHVWLVKRTHK